MPYSNVLIIFLNFTFAKIEWKQNTVGCKKQNNLL